MGNNFKISTNLVRSLRHTGRRRPNKRRVYRASSGKLVLSQKTLAITLLVLLAGLGLAYLVMVNTRVSKGFKVAQMQEQIAELQKRQRALEQQAASLQSIQTIQKHLDMGQFVPATDVTYLNLDQDFAFGQ